MNLFALPTVLVARGCLAPYFLDWWKRTPALLHIADFSRWRWFEFGAAAEPRWIGEPPAKRQAVLFDRNTTTGQTLKLLKTWLKADGYDPVVIGHLDRRMGRFGLRYLDFVWDDGEGYDRLGLVCDQAENGVRLVPVADYSVKLGGAYTFCVIGGQRPEIGGINAPESVDVRTEAVSGDISVVFQNVPSWEQAMILGYVNQKPLITIAGAPGVVADYSWNDDLGEVADYLREESL